MLLLIIVALSCSSESNEHQRALEREPIKLFDSNQSGSNDIKKENSTDPSSVDDKTTSQQSNGSTKEATKSEPNQTKKKLPKLVDLGAKSCVPCKMMAPIMEDLEKNYKDKMEVVFIDVWKNPNAGKEYKIRLIPTQIFYDPSGKELFRHEGFYSKEDILKKWKELGFEF